MHQAIPEQGRWLAGHKGLFREGARKLARSSRWKTGPGKTVAGRPVVSVA